MANKTKGKNDFYELSWCDTDIENRIGLGIFSAGKYTDVNIFISLIVGTLFFGVIYCAVEFLSRLDVHAIQLVNERIVSGGVISYITLFFFAWSLAVLFLKSQKLKTQRAALGVSIVSQNDSYWINQESAVAILKRIRDSVDNPKRFILFGRIEAAISNLSNIGNVGDVSSVLSAQERTDQERIDSSFVLLNTINWIIPILGFIGTVLGLGVAIGGFGETVKASQDISAIKESITGISAGLGTAFDTTLVALVAVVILQFLVSIQMSKELAFLEECSLYCQENILAKLKIRK